MGGLTGALGGLLSTGNPLGAIAGGLSGLFGGDDEKQTVSSARALSGAQSNVVKGASSNLDALFAGVDPGVRDLMSRNLGKKFSGILGDATRRSFGRARSTSVANLQRTGGGPSSIMAGQLAEIGGAESRALQEAEMQGQLMGEQFAQGRFASNLQGAGAMSSIINQTYQGQGTGTVSESTPGSGLMGSIAGMGNAMTNPNSYYSQNKGVFGRFSAPIFGGKKSTGNRGTNSLPPADRYQMIPSTPGPGVQGPVGAPVPGTMSFMGWS